MMGDIYAISRSVLVWLGKADSKAEDAVNVITKFGTALRNGIPMVLLT
jgi:hypothetical protein